ncbi:hypothetical protein L195_g015989, partial [Trifolium pratense]
RHYSSLLDQLDNKIMEQVSMILWAIWWGRNQKCWNDKFPTTFEVNKQATKALDDWLKVKATRLINHIPVIQEAEQRWCKRRPGTLTCNVDAACYAEANQF